MSRQYLDVLRRNLIDALRRNDRTAAGQLLSRLREEDPLSAQTRCLELEVLIHDRRADDAARLAAQLVELFPSSARILHFAGRAAYRTRDYAEAERRLRESGRLAPRRQTDHWLGKTLTQKGDFDEAEALLLRTLPDNPWVGLDLAWLYERKGDLTRALRYVEAFLEQSPDNEFAGERRLRLRAQTMEASELRDEVETLRELGEEVPDALIPEYVDRLLRTGDGKRAREVALEAAPRVAVGIVADMAWKAYKLQAHDLAAELFLRALPANLRRLNFLNSLEAAAVRCGRVDDVVEAYRRHAPQMPNLYGRAKELEKRALR